MTSTPMHPHALLVERFYTSFRRRDPDGMAGCYHRDVTFSNPIFPLLRGDRARAMWRMLLGRAASLDATFGDVRADDERGSARWEATYPFSATGRVVHNVADASFAFEDGKIIRHEDKYNLWRWAAMALGPKGRLLGWSSLVKRGIRKAASEKLDAFIAGA